MATKKRKKPSLEDQFAERFELRMTTEDKERFQEAALNQGLTLSQWIRFACRLVFSMPVTTLWHGKES
jgi:hypothetical protein